MNILLLQGKTYQVAMTKLDACLIHMSTAEIWSNLMLFRDFTLLYGKASQRVIFGRLDVCKLYQFSHKMLLVFSRKKDVYNILDILIYS